MALSGKPLIISTELIQAHRNRLILSQDLRLVRDSEKDLENVASILVNEIDSTGNSPLHIACSMICGDATTLLVENGADVNQPDGNGNTPLHLLTRLRRYAFDLEPYEFLIKHGASLDSQNSAGLSPLGAAILKNSLVVVKFLLNQGSNPHLKTFQGSNIAHTAVSPAHNSQQTLISKPILLHLVHHVPGLDWNAPNYLGAVPMHKLFPALDFRGLVLNRALPLDDTPPILWRVPWAASLCWDLGDRPFRRLVRAYGNDVLRRVINVHPADGGWSPTCVAAWYGLLGSLKNLVLIGADVEWEGHETGTPLMTACERGHLRIARYLIQQGAKVEYMSARTGEYRSALQAAGGNERLRQWLLVGRWLEQLRIGDVDGNPEREVVCWSGYVQARVPLRGVLARSRLASAQNWLAKLWRLREEFKGTVVMDIELDFDARGEGEGEGWRGDEEGLMERVKGEVMVEVERAEVRVPGELSEDLEEELRRGEERGEGDGLAEEGGGEGEPHPPQPVVSEEL